ncbi:MAG: cysteine--tRNA ligase [Desulfobacter postgatei]|uniref:Cysteine--tRNA ligase n=1 Tax=Desulfobacter postgatei TaxID=2293 RepID=A0A2G6MTA1_9BACT|nr:MAG: cysteine--tRNA ligase [Desulfobacter postgatei]
MYASIIESIGNTPLVKIQTLNPVPGVTILAKLEYMNPGGSIKDRAALYMINQAEADGELAPGKTVIEATSGNTGIGLAMICAVKGYRLALTMSESASEERKKILNARGARIILTPRHLGSDGAIEEAYRLAREYPDKYFLTDQYNNEANWKAHYHTTGPEIVAQTNGQVDAVVATVGTSGTLMGLSRYFRDQDHHARVICAEPYLGHGIQGLKNMKESYRPEIFNKTLLDESVYIEDDTAFETARQLAAKEGLFVGMSSGAAMAVALEHAKRLENGVIVVIFPDSGERYLSTELFSVKKNIHLTVYNSLGGQKESFNPQGDKEVGIYTCGPTVHRRLDITHFRRYAFTDLLIRYLEYQDVKVKHIVNITDYDDKTIEGARQAKTSLEAFTQPFIDVFLADLSRLGMRPAQAYPKVSEHFTEMTDMARKLLVSKHAYEKLHSVYFDLSSFGDYGQLSRVDLNKIRVGATVDLDEYEKNNPRDFTLFKRVKLSELKQGLGVKTEWGNVRPSLHLQCAAFASTFLGADFDIHTGSRELMFPHHENEIAIARAAGGSFARVWMHCHPIQYDGSLDTDDAGSLTLDRLVEMGWDEKTIRFWLLSAHYRKSLRLSRKSLDDAQTVLSRINRCIESLGHVSGQSNEEKIQHITYDLRQGMMDAMANDLKVPVLVSGILSGVKRINRMVAAGQVGPRGAQRLLNCFKDMDAVLNMFDFSTKVLYSSEVTSLMAERDAARQQKDFKTADRIRKQLDDMGILIHDQKV